MNKITQLFKVIADRWNRWLDGLSPYNPDAVRTAGMSPVEIDDTPVKKIFVHVVVISFVAFALWAFFAPLDAGVSVTGTVVVSGNRKAVQHPTGGVVESILVSDGAKVKKGDLLLKLNPLNVEANLSSAELDYINAMAAESRLQAEHNNTPIHWMDDLEVMGTDPRVREAKQLQMYMFESRNKDYEGQRHILQEQLEGNEKQYKELLNVQKFRQRQLELMTEEMKSNKELSDDGYVPRSKANETERTMTDMMASMANTSSDISRALSAMAGIKLQIVQLLNTRRKETDGQLADMQKNRKSLKGKVDVMRFDLSLVEIRSPVSGVVMNTKVFTVGGVIPGGSVLMEIVPQDSMLIIEAQIPTTLIDKVHKGLEADIRFSSFNMNTTPVIPGKVKQVSVDKVSNPPAPEYYQAEIETTVKGRILLGGNIVQPGMPVEVIIKTGERSFMSYLSKPISDRFAKSFKED